MQSLRTRKPVQRANEDLGQAWVTPELRHEFGVRESLLQAAKGSDAVDDWEKFKVHRNKCTHLFNEAREAHFRRLKPTAVRIKAPEFFCDACDIALATSAALQQHRQSHHPTSSSIFSSLTDNDLKKYLLERRAKYPTCQNVQRSLEAREEMLKRGERLNLNPRKKGKTFQPKKKNARAEKGRKREEKTKRTKKTKPLPWARFEDDHSDDERPFKRFRGLLRPAEDFAAKVADEDHWSADELNTGCSKTALNSLAADYASGSDEPPEECRVKREADIPPQQTAQETTPKQVLAHQSVETSAEKLVEKAGKNRRKKQRTRKMPNTPQESVQKPKRPTLLQRLLKTEIETERNMVLQCIRYVVRNRFFDKC